MGTTGTSFLIAILVTSGVLLIVASWAAFATRRVKYLLYKESRFIGFGVYNLVLISAVGIGLIAGLTDQPIAQFWVRAACLLLAPFLVVSSLMLPKLYYMYRGFDKFHPSDNSSDGTSTSQSSLSGDESTDKVSLLSRIALLSAQNEHLRVELRKLSSDATHHRPQFRKSWDPNTQLDA